MALNAEYLPATGGPRQDLVLLHGWGCNREIWRPLLAEIRPWANVTLLDLPGCAPGAGADEPELGSLVQGILAVAPPQAVYVGWSLGGQIAFEIAARHADRVCGVVSVCSNPRFVAGEGWPGMAPGEFATFDLSFREDPAASLRRFDSLQTTGSTRPRQLLRQVRAIRGGGDSTGLEVGLGWLSSLDQRSLATGLACPRLHLFAAGDVLVPPACARLVSGRAGAGRGVEVITLDHGCHLLPLERPADLGRHILEFLGRRGLLRENPASAPALDKEDVASSFSRAARNYDSVASLQRDVGTRLLTRLDQLDDAPRRILDLGCGTGYFLPELMQRFPEAEYIGLDLARGMVEYARGRFPRTGQWVVGDAESLPLVGGSVDLVFSSLAIQWCYRPELLFAELARVLAPGGRCVFTSLGPDTLRELRSSWAAVDQHQHVNTFLPPGELECAADRVPGLALGLKSEQFSMHYHRVLDLLHELKMLGAHNINRQRPSGLTSRRALQGMMDAYECWRENGTLPATYDVLFGVLEKT